ncbi:MAG: hypothetical protein MI746_14085 [Pseudomonadales bacterium]|nr:hypothetical protein [Pseudomonadales bacterium]
MAIQTRNPANTAALDGGALGIPANQTLAGDTHGASVLNGTITMQWRQDSSAMSGITYTLRALGVTPPVQWEESGGCLTAGLC